MSYQFTVVLKRPDYMNEDDDSANPYLALISVDEVTPFTKLVQLARKEVFKADTKDGLDPQSTDDYALLFVLSGHHTPLMWGWQE